jgi:hypothetical protein
MTQGGRRKTGATDLIACLHQALTNGTNRTSTAQTGTNGPAQTGPDQPIILKDVCLC